MTTIGVRLPSAIVVERVRCFRVVTALEPRVLLDPLGDALQYHHRQRIPQQTSLLIPLQLALILLSLQARNLQQLFLRPRTQQRRWHQLFQLRVQRFYQLAIQLWAQLQHRRLSQLKIQL